MNQTDKLPTVWRWRLGFILAVFLPSVFYLPTVYPTYCFFSDSGDFMTASTLLTLAHPTGYPWFCLLGKLFVTLFPFGEVVWRYGLLTALFVPLTAGIVFLLMMCLTDHVPIALATAWTMAFGKMLWYSSVAMEVYSANLFLTMLALYALVRFWQTEDKRWFYTVGLTVGFGAAHHLTLPLMAIGGLAGLLLSWRWLPKRPSARDWLVAMLFACLPLTFYAYLPIRAPKPYGYRYWQLTGDDPSASVRDFLRYVTGQRFRYMMGVLTLQQQAQRFGQWLKMGWQQYSFLFVLGMFFGWLSWRQHRAFLLVTVGMVLAHMAFYLSYAVPDIVYFFVPSWSTVVLWGGLSFHQIWQWLRERNNILAIIVVALALGSVEGAFINALPSVWGGDKQRGQRYLDAVLRDVPRDAALLVNVDDVLFHLWAVQAIEERRKDVLVLAVYQWQPILPVTRRVVAMTADVYRFFNPAPWHLRPLTKWIAEFDETPAIVTVGRCQRHEGDKPFVHRSWLKPPPDGVHIGALLVAHVELCVDNAVASKWGYLWLIAKQGVPITDDNGPNSNGWAWWWFYQPIPQLPQQGRWLVRIDACLPFAGNALPGKFEVRELVLSQAAKLPENADQMRVLWLKANRLGVVKGWGR